MVIIAFLKTDGLLRFYLRFCTSKPYTLNDFTLDFEVTDLHFLLLRRQINSGTY